MQYTIRFVGGPWHNRLEHLDLLPRVVVRRALPTTTLSMSYAGVFAAAKLREDVYYLARYETLRGTEYYQYIHSTLVQGRTAATSTFREQFPRWVIRKRELDARIRKAFSRAAESKPDIK